MNSVNTMLKHAKPIFLLITTMTICFASKCQVPINCCQINQYISIFKSDTLWSDDEFVMVKSKILPPICKSKSKLEIRFLTSQKNFDILLDIYCLNGVVHVDRYTTVLIAGKQMPVNDEFIDVGGLSNGVHVLLKKKSGLHLTKNGTWSSFFNLLIKNHLYDLPREATLNVLIKKQYSDVEILGGGKTIIELKVGNHFRNLIYTCNYSPEPKQVKEWLYQKKIYQLFNQFYQQ